MVLKCVNSLFVLRTSMMSADEVLSWQNYLSAERSSLYKGKK